MLSKEKIRIENARLYPPAIVDQIQTALSNGAELHADESRRNFYDLDFDGRTYFIYVSPLSGNVTLIAAWVQKHPSADEKPDGQGKLVADHGSLPRRLVNFFKGWSDDSLGRLRGFRTCGEIGCHR